jgi:hypothetical protein
VTLRRRDRTVVVRSPLSPSAAVARLAVGRIGGPIGGRWHPAFTGTQGLRPVVVGVITEDSVRLAVHRGGRRRWWQPVLRGRFETRPDGCAFVGSFGLSLRGRTDEQVLHDWLTSKLAPPNSA